MKTNSTGSKIGCIILIVLIIAAQVVIFLTSETSTLLKTGTAISTIALVSALIYVMTGFGKKGAKFFMIYMLLYSLAEIPTFIGQIMKAVNREPGQAVMMLVTAISIIALIILALMKDLGRKVSFTLVTVILVLDLLTAFVSIFMEASGGAIIGIPVAIIQCGQRILLAAVAYLLVQAKYADKEARGTQ